MYSGDLNSLCEVNGAPVDMMMFVLNADDNLVAFCEQRDQKGVSMHSVHWLVVSDARCRLIGRIILMIQM